MSSTASNYNIRRLNWGIAVTTLSVMLILEATFEPLLRARAVGSWIGIVTSGYGVMMFASSYVEEEQQFWYWMKSVWLGWLFLRQYVEPSILACLLTDTVKACHCNTTRTQWGWSVAGPPDDIESCPRMEPDWPEARWGTRYRTDFTA